jgi:hypothetical protein
MSDTGKDIKGTFTQAMNEGAIQAQALVFADMPYLEEPRTMDKTFIRRIARSLVVPASISLD